VEQVLVTNTVIHMFDRERFDSLARSYTRRFSESFDAEEAAAAAAPAAPEEGVPGTLDRDAYDDGGYDYGIGEGGGGAGAGAGASLGRRGGG
jgi:hypothetical protein